ncbi:DUF2937 family protein [Sulfitobacter sp. PS-8MA]|uniref:DUF2937 family protein n=1 Tax=Sulfitobacter sp. PS-8MA TaxID=3237707 RepID=UPI0034C62576
MILRALTLAGGIISAGIAAQGPGFARAYVFELAAAEQVLAQVVADFDAAARAAGLEPAAALDRLRGSALLDRRRVDLERHIARHARLRADLSVLRDAGPFLRSFHMLRVPDVAARRAAWANFQPKAPRSRAEMIFALTGFALGLLSTRFILWLPTWPRRRRALRS